MIVKRRVIVYIAFFYIFLSWTPLVQTYVTKGSYLILFLLILTAAWAAAFNQKLHPTVLWVTPVLMSCSTLYAWHWQQLELAFFSVYIIYSIILISMLKSSEINKLINIATKFMTILLVGAILGFIIAVLGVDPLIQINHTDGKAFYLYYTTFTNSVSGNIIRPSGVYDEPGAFSFAICALVAFRTLRGFDQKISTKLLLAGFITFSVAHVIFAVIYIFALHFSSTRDKAWSMVFVFLLIIITPLLAIFTPVGDLLIGRIYFENEFTLGDSRIKLIESAFTRLNEIEGLYIWGFGPESSSTLSRESFDPLGSNPLTPLVNDGVVLSLPYYLYMSIGIFSLFMFIFGKGYKNLIFFAVVILFAQRPLVMTLGYSGIAVLSLVLWRSSVREKSIVQINGKLR